MSKTAYSSSLAIILGLLMVGGMRSAAAKDLPLPPKPLTAVRPVYPPAAKAAGIEGIVTLRCTIEKDGSVSTVELLKGDPQLAPSAMAAARQWRFPPMEAATVTDLTLTFTIVKGDDAGIYTAPMPIYAPDPPYTRKAEVARRQGVVELRTLIAPDGSVGDVKITKRLGMGLDENAVRTVKSWKYLPAMKEGKPIPITIMVQVNFRLR